MKLENNLQSIYERVQQMEKDMIKEPLCNISVTKNTKDFNFHISVYDGCTKEMIDDVIMKTMYGVKGLRDELNALKETEVGK